MKLAKNELGRYLAVGCTSKFSAETHHDVTTVHKSTGRFCPSRSSLQYVARETCLARPNRSLKRLTNNRRRMHCKNMLWLYKQERSLQQRRLLLASASQQFVSWTFFCFFFLFNWPDTFDRKELAACLGKLFCVFLSLVLRSSTDIRVPILLVSNSGFGVIHGTRFSLFVGRVCISLCVY